MVTVRLATAADAPAMGRLVVRAWQAAYRGHMPDDYLDGLRAQDRAAGWERVLGVERPRGTGAGRALLEAAQAELARLGFDETVLWVLPANARARRFYELAGWASDGTERTVDALGVTVPEVRYRRRSRSEDSSSTTPLGTE
jgi:GNAT superfamily N-acetyltransferase